MAFFHIYNLITPQDGSLTGKQPPSASSFVALFFDIVLCKLILDRLQTSTKLFSRLWFFLRPGGGSGAELLEERLPEQPEKKEKEMVISRDDVEVVMGKLGFSSDPEGCQLEQTMGCDRIVELFDEKEPSLEEVKEAFDVFDVNGDGFVDEFELRRVMCLLGFREGFEVERCREMIRRFDENGDGRIEFSEFVKFMENSFSS